MLCCCFLSLLFFLPFSFVKGTDRLREATGQVHRKLHLAQGGRKRIQGARASPEKVGNAIPLFFRDSTVDRLLLKHYDVFLFSPKNITDSSPFVMILFSYAW